MCDVTRDLPTPPLLQTATFFRLLPPLELEVLYARPQNIYNAPFSYSETLRPNYSAHAVCYSSIQERCLCWPLRMDTTCTWNYYPCHLSSRRDDLRLSCLLTQALMPLESIANLNDAIL